MLYALQKNTILSSSIDDNLVKNVDHTALLDGYNAGTEFGLSRALYHVRLLELFNKMDENQRVYYYLGAVLASDLQAFKSIKEKLDFEWIVVGGSNPLRQSFTYLLNQLDYTNVIEATDEQVLLSTIIGGKLVADMKMNEFNA
jgi:2-dehydro-3-deoxygalactonokinase